MPTDELDYISPPFESAGTRLVVNNGKVVGYGTIHRVSALDGTLTDETYLTTFIHATAAEAREAGKRLPNFRKVVALVEISEGSERA